MPINLLDTAIRSVRSLIGTAARSIALRIRLNISGGISDNRVVGIVYSVLNRLGGTRRMFTLIKAVAVPSVHPDGFKFFGCIHKEIPGVKVS